MDASEQFGHWEIVRSDLLRALDLLADEQLAFVPHQGLWSLGKVACHIAEAEEGWFRYAVNRELAEWPEFQAEDYPTVEAVKALLAGVHVHTQAYLATVSGESLDQPHTMPWGKEMLLREVIWHVVEHEIHHRGEIYLMLGLMGMEAPSI